ncbi:MAG: NAD(P)/FAD-dependent oxidoreductase [Pseudomonadota bacterium]
MSTLPNNPDVIVVGAGTAGLSAAKSLMHAGLEVVVLEAQGHVGGRCVTDTSVFDTPFDRGGSWLHSAEINPLAQLANDAGVRLHKKPWRWEQVISNGRKLNEQEVSAYVSYQDSMWEAVHEASKDDTSDVIEDLLPRSPWKDTARHFVAQMLGGDAEVTSATDSARYGDAEGDWLVSGGLGAFVKSLHADVPVKLNCPVSKIDYSGNDVQAVTPDGTVKADYLVVTVSTGVLSAETIMFNPVLPDQKRTAIGQLPNGLLNKIGIEFDPHWKEVHEGYMADYHSDGNAFCTLLFGFFNTNLAVGFVAGSFADLLEQEGEGAAQSFCLEGLRELFGNDVTKHVIRTTETAWRNNPATIGSYSYASPGCADARSVLAEPVDDRLFFAGEATMQDAFATVHGAYLSGKNVAREIIERHSSGKTGKGRT